MYCSGPWQLHPRIRRAQRKIRSFFTFGPAPGKARRPRRGKSPREMNSPTATCRAGPATRLSISLLTEESVMRITAWIVRGLGAGPLAYMVIPGKRSRASS